MIQDYFRKQTRAGFYCLQDGNVPKFVDMEQTIHWPDGEFTLPAAVALNPALPEAVVRRKLSAALAAKVIVQTRKGDGKVQGAFQLVKVNAETKLA